MRCPSPIAAIWSGLLALTAGCAQEPAQLPDTTHSRDVTPELPLDLLAQVPVPDADGPFLAPTALAVIVHERPETGAKRIGYLRLGARVARSPEPVSRQDCPAGWYAVRPVGYVCADDQVTLDMEDPLVRAFTQEPKRDQAMPYAYAFVRATAPNYLRVPDKAEQERREMRLGRHLRNFKKFASEWNQVEVGANDVPLSTDGLAAGEPPTEPQSASLLQRLGGSEEATAPWWLADGKRHIANVSEFRAPAYAVMAGRIKRHAGVALLTSFKADERAGGRGFSVTTDGRLIPADKLKPDAASAFHGVALREIGLPVAFAYKPGASLWRHENGQLTRGQRLKPREFLALTGKVRRLGGVRMAEVQGGLWVRSADVKTATKPRDLPWFATGDRRWIQISLLNQSLVLWEGATPVYATLVSTGRDGLADPDTTLSTPQGTFRIYQKHVTTTMDSNAADKEYELRDVPWVMYFKGGYALHGAYWHDDFGRPRSHGCVNLSPIDARYVFQWSTPDVPEHWHGSDAGNTFAQGTLVHIQP